MSKLLYVLGAVLIGYVLIVSWLFYAGTCNQIKNWPIPTQVPNRCISMNPERSTK